MPYRRRLQQTNKRKLPGYNTNSWKQVGRMANAVRVGATLGKQAAGVYKKFTATNRASSSNTTTRTKQNAKYQYCPQTGNDYQRIRARYGKRITTKRRSNALLRNTLRRSVFTIRDYGAWRRGNGNIQLTSAEAVAAGLVEQPVHVWDVSAVPQVSTAGSTINHPYIRYHLFFSNSTSSGVVQWERATGGGYTTITDSENPGVSTGLNKTVQMYPTYMDSTEYSSSATISHTGALPGAKSFLESVNAKLAFYSPTQAPTRIQVQLVQFADDVTPGKTSDLATAFWQSMSKSWGYSPLEQGDYRLRKKYMKVLKTVLIDMEAPESTEDHVNARMKHLDFSMNLNRRCNYKWGKAADKMELDSADTPENASFDSGDVPQCFVHPNARVYLLVRGLVTFRQAGDAATSSNSPSYDIKLSSTHRSFD